MSSSRSVPIKPSWQPDLMSTYHLTSRRWCKRVQRRTRHPVWLDKQSWSLRAASLHPSVASLLTTATASVQAMVLARRKLMVATAWTRHSKIFRSQTTYFKLALLIFKPTKITSAKTDFSYRNQEHLLLKKTSIGHFQTKEWSQMELWRQAVIIWDNHPLHGRLISKWPH